MPPTPVTPFGTRRDPSLPPAAVATRRLLPGFTVQLGSHGHDGKAPRKRDADRDPVTAACGH